MKNILILFLMISLLSSCDETKRETTKTDLETETEKKQDTIYNYWELSLDTISDHKKIKILNKNYSLDLKTFSLNDSLIVRNLGQEGEQVYLDHSHTMVTDFALLADSIIDRKRIDRTDFKQSLNSEFYKECNLYSTAIDSIVGNTIYLTSDLAVPDTDNQWRIWYLIKVTNNRLGNIEIKETNYVGQ
tara:strand:+ start:67 stop:630 length:564 start_codon:yes stop_codon:yes gene_type:complete